MKRSPPRLAPLFLLLCAAIVGAQTTPTRPSSYTPSFQNVDIAVVADAVGAATGITFLPNPTVRANVSLILPAGARPLTSQQFYAMFLSMLGQYGFVAMPAGNGTMKIVQEQSARTMPGNDLPTSSNLAADEIVTDVLETKNVNGLQVSTVLRSFISQAGQIVPVPGTNSMIITDRAGNVARLKRILSRVDQSSNSDIQMIPLENAIASEVARLLSSLLAAQPADAGGGGVVPRVQADDRTNSIVVSGDPAQRLRISALAADLDAPVSTGGGTQVFALEYATATDLATTLNAQVTGQSTSTGTTGGGGGGAAGAAAAPSVAANADRNVKIIAHEATNKLIITAPSRQMLALTSIIEALDVPPDQVHIEAIVAEITDTKAADLGVNWAVFSNDQNTNVPISGFISPIAGASVVDLAAAVQDSSANPIPTGATFAVGRVKDTGISLAAMFRALRTEDNSNIVSLPNVTATNNKEAEMKSGQEVPFLSGQYTNTGGGGGGGAGGGSVNPFNTVQRKSVGTNLKVTPQIIAGKDEVILNIELTSSSLANKLGDGGSLITNERSVKTSVRVRSGTTIVIGGMIKNDNQDTETRVPWLSKIPIIGEAFKTRGRSREKSNMMVFIQPRILSDSLQASAETASRYNAIRDAQDKTDQKKEMVPLLPRDNTSVLPQLPPPPPPVAPTNPGPRRQ